VDKRSSFREAAEASSQAVNSMPDSARALSKLVRDTDIYHQNLHKVVKAHIEQDIISNLPANFAARISVKSLDHGQKCLLVSFRRYKNNSFLNGIFNSPISVMHWRIDFTTVGTQCIKLYASGDRSYDTSMSMRHESSKFFNMYEDIGLLFGRLERITLAWIKTGYVSLDK
jgi:hypothetical protein